MKSQPPCLRRPPDRRVARILSMATAFVAMAATVAALPLSAQSGGEVLRTALDRYEARMEGVENYTVVQEVMGFESETYFERREVEDRSMFVPRAEEGSRAGQGAPQAPYTDFIALADRAAIEGTATVDGEESYMVTVTDFEGVDVWNPAAGGQAGDFAPERARFCIDSDDYLIRRMEMSGTVSVRGGDEEEVSFVADFRDYREVEGLVHPFVIQVTVEGLADQISPEQREELRSSLEEMRAQMAEMSEEQRQMVEEMMSGQLERMETMLAQGTGEPADDVGGREADGAARGRRSSRCPSSGPWMSGSPSGGTTPGT